MSDTVIVRLLGDSREDLELGIARLRSAGLDIEWRSIDELEDGQVDGVLRLYDTPETAQAKAKAAGSAVRSLLDRFEYP